MSKDAIQVYSSWKELYFKFFSNLVSMNTWYSAVVVWMVFEKELDPQVAVYFFMALLGIRGAREFGREYWEYRRGRKVEDATE